MSEREFVRPSAVLRSTVVELSPVDQLYRNLWIRSTINFPLSHDADVVHICSHLKKALSVTLSHIPIIGGRIVEKDPAKETFGIVINEDAGAFLEYQDHRKTIETTFKELQYNHFPDAFLEAECLWPCDFPPKKIVGSHCLAVKINIIHGGLLLTTVLAHLAGDGVGRDIFAKRWAESCRLESRIGREKIQEIPNQALYRQKLTGNQIPFNAEQYSSRTSLGTGNRSLVISAHMPQEPFASGLWKITSAHIMELKSLMRGFVSDDIKISTFETVASLLVRHVSLVSRSLPEDRATLDVSIPRNVRLLLNPPITDEFVGNASLATSVSFCISEIQAADEFLVCQKMRLGIHRALKNWNSTLPDVLDSIASTPHFGQIVPPLARGGIVLNDVSKSPQSDWGEQLGKPICTRGRPPSIATPWSRIFFQPRELDSDLEILVQTPQSVHVKLAQKAAFREHFELLWEKDVPETSLHLAKS